MPTYTIDARVIQDHFPGIGRFAWNLLQAMVLQLEPDERLRVIHAPVDAPAANTRYPSFWTQLPKHQLDLLQVATPIFSPKNMLARDLHRGHGVFHHQYHVRPYLQKAGAITTIYDAIGFVIPDSLPSARSRLILRLSHALAIARSERILTISKSAARDLARFFPSAGSKLYVTLGAADAAFTRALPARISELTQRMGLPDAFALYLASNKPHKNLPALVEAWARPEGEQLPTLIIGGHQDARYPQARHLAERLRLGDRVRFVGAVAEADMPALYSACSFFVYPSLYEGFGLTPLEAMACGAPVVCSNASSLPEVTGDAAIQFDPSNATEMAVTCREMWTDPQKRASYAERSLMQSRKFSWADTAAATLGVYRELTERNQMQRR